MHVSQEGNLGKQKRLLWRHAITDLSTTQRMITFGHLDQPVIVMNILVTGAIYFNISL